MKIIVCVKQVPDTTEVRLDPVTGTLLREGIPSIINPDDKAGLEAALRLKDRYEAHVTVLTMGPPQADLALREALAMGAAEAILLTDRAFGGADPWATSSTLASALSALEYDLIITGRQAIDGDTAQVGPQIAEHLGIPNISYAEELRIEWEYRGGPAPVRRPHPPPQGEDALPCHRPFRAERTPLHDPPGDLRSLPGQDGENTHPGRPGHRRRQHRAQGLPHPGHEVLHQGGQGKRNRGRAGRRGRGGLDHRAAPGKVRPVTEVYGMEKHNCTGVMIFVQPTDGEIAPVSLELLGKGRELAAALGAEVTAALLGSCIQPLCGTLARYGADRIVVVDDPALETYMTEPYTRAMTEVVRRFPPELLCAPPPSEGISRPGSPPGSTPASPPTAPASKSTLKPETS